MHIRSTILLVFLALPVAAQEGTNSIEERIQVFELGRPCGGKMALVIETLSNDANEIGLTKDAVRTLVRSRMRAARIYDTYQYARPWLYINVHVVSRAFSIAIQFKQRVYRIIVHGEDKTRVRYEGTAVTWSNGFTGTHGYDQGYILQALSRMVDKFIDEYLDVNEKICQMEGRM